ncbi:fibrobacter succinogenes major paralogous domain-containing protein [candidate division KSB1 bacterium]|nr:fibrobacter succinogenes major paralogous domain-containing protein [candidate division KSB1 bacterium]
MNPVKKIGLSFFLFIFGAVISVVNCDKSPTETKNGQLKAAFSVHPDMGTIETVFIVDAAGCSDSENPADALNIRLDWENDGIWDTDYSTNKTVTHQFTINDTVEDKKTIKLEVLNTRGQKNTATSQIYLCKPGKVADIDGNIYKTLKIGDLWWMAENLKTTRYRNGQSIPNVTDTEKWVALSTAAYCEYGNNINTVAVYGRYYNGYAVLDSRNIAPSGWHVATDEDWQKLEMFLGMSQTDAERTFNRGTIEGGKLKEAGTAHWPKPNYGATNESGFCALPGGFRNNWGTYQSMGEDAYFWCSTERIWTSDINRHVDLWMRSLDDYYLYISRNSDMKLNGMSVRCVKD